MKTNTQKWPAIVGAVLLAAAAVNAADLVWIGGTGNWNAAANWSPAEVPGATDTGVSINNLAGGTLSIGFDGRADTKPWAARWQRAALVGMGS